MARSSPLVSLTAAAALAACGGGGAGDGDGGPDDIDSGDPPDMCGDVRTANEVFYGTLQPEYVPLTPGQIMAVGDFDGCSGSLIAPTWVLTARHCGLSSNATFCIGEDASNPNVCIDAVRAVDNPDRDMTLVELEQDATVAAPGVEPVPVITEMMDASWVGETAEAAGYGQTETGSTGTRLFTAEPIDSVSGDYVAINGEGVHGVCFGDSGGPLFVIATDGTVRVAGALSYGDSSCVDIDNFTRVDLSLEWIESFTGPTIVDGGCGSVDGVGRCLSGEALYCENDELVRESCEVGTACGWSDAAGGYRCIAGEDPCGGVDGLGRCDGDTARWCENGEPKSRDCAACGQICQPFTQSGGAYCSDDPCMGLDFLGRCNGDVAEWCDGGQLNSRDCAADGQVCDYINDEIGYWCRNP